MRIYDQENEKKTNNVLLLLTPDEAKEIKDSLEILLKDEKHHHSHIPDKEYKREVTVSIYRENNLSSFDEHSRKLILNNE